MVNSLESRARWKRRRVVVAAMTTLVVVAAGCGGDDAAVTSSTDDPQAGDADGAAAADGLSVAYVDGNCANSWRVHVRAELEDEAAQHADVGDVTYACAQGRMDSAISHIQNYTLQEVDVLLVLSDWGAPLLPEIRKAHQAGIPTVAWAIPLGGEPGTDYTAYVGDDFEVIGTITAEYFIDKLDGEGTIVGIGGAAGNNWDLDYVEVMTGVFEEEAPDIEWLELAWGDWDPATSGQVMGTLLNKYDEIDAVWLIEPTGVKPAIDQFLAAGRPLPTFVTFDANGLARIYEDLKPDHPTLDIGFLSGRVSGIRNALQIGLAEARGEDWDESLTTIDNEVLDCETECDDLYIPEMPDSYYFTSQVDPEVLAEMLGEEGFVEDFEELEDLDADEDAD